MERTSSMLGMLASLSLLVGVGCDDPNASPGGTTGAPGTSAKPAAAASAATGAGSAVAGADSAAPAASAAVAPAEGAVAAPAHTVPDLSSEYSIADALRPDGKAYKGQSKWQKTGDIFGLSWDIEGNPPMNGVGIPVGKWIGVGYGVGDNVGVMVYKVSGGELSGTWASPKSKGKLGMENLKGPDSLEGEYEITEAKDPDGKAYKGKATFKPQGEAIAISWKMDEATYSGAAEYGGIGIKEGDYLIVGWGEVGKDFGAGLYTIDGEKITGKWIGGKDTKFGKETLAKGDADADDAEEGGEDDLLKEMMDE